MSSDRVLGRMTFTCAWCGRQFLRKRWGRRPKYCCTAHRVADHESIGMPAGRRARLRALAFLRGPPGREGSSSDS